MWSSIAYQPIPLVQALVKGKVWSRALPLHPSERVPIDLAQDGPKAKGGAASADEARDASQAAGA